MIQLRNFIMQKKNVGNVLFDLSFRKAQKLRNNLFTSTFSILGISGVVRNVVALFLQFGNAFNKLRNGGGNVGQFNDVALRSLCKFSQCCQFVGNSLLWRQSLGKMCDQTILKCSLGQCKLVQEQDKSRRNSVSN